MGKPSLIPFEPFPGLGNPIAQTILGAQIPGRVDLPPRTLHKIPLSDTARLVCLELPGSRPEAPVCILMHGMGGCSESAYMRRIALKLHQQGLGVFMVNHRGSGPGMGLADRLWNGGSSEDLAGVVGYVTARFDRAPVILAGFSLSGNILLKYLGEGNYIPRQVRAALAVNPPVDLKAASLAISTGPWAGTFNRYYMRLINRQMRALRECYPESFAPAGEPRTIYEFDAAYTAPAAGFRDVEDYYRQCSAGPCIENITVPTTILCSRDDPFIPSRVFDELRPSLCVELYRPERGGHMGYLARRGLPTGDRRWMDYFVVQWALESLPAPARL